MSSDSLEYRFLPFQQLMQAQGLPGIVIDTFRYHYAQLLAGATGLIPETDISPVDTLPDADVFGDDLRAGGLEAIRETAVIKLNGGLGTSMGLERAKSLIRVKDGLSFLDIIARQALVQGTPLILMDSFATRADTLEVLKQYPELHKHQLALDFLQHKVPKIDQRDLAPVRWPAAPQLEWSPPGHGDIYPALVTSGMLDALLASGYRYVFISNADNLGAVLDPYLLGHFVSEDMPFLMEVTDRTESDSKGGHLARAAAGQLMLRESAQCPPQDMDSFQDIRRHKFFNTNNLWLNLQTFKHTLEQRNHVLGLSIIRNKKTVDPRDATSTPVYQLETAMGSAISVFNGARAVRVPRSRFAPVKTTNDLLVIRSDAYRLTGDYRIVLDDKLAGRIPAAELDQRFYKLIDAFESRFSGGAPSLAACTALSVTGDISFGAGVTVQGRVALRNAGSEQVEIKAGTVIDADSSWG
jgi:UDP-N-acetylglucosamine pyrophosphorylase